MAKPEQEVVTRLNFQEFVKRQINDIGRCRCRNVQAEVGRGCKMVLNDEGFELILHELVNNCAEKKTQEPDIDIGVYLYRSTVDGKQGFVLKVTDNVKHPPGEEDRLNKKVIAVTIKKRQKKHKGQIGKYLTIRQMQQWGGSFHYEQENDGTIVAIAQWTEYYFQHPKDISLTSEVAKKRIKY